MRSRAVVRAAVAACLLSASAPAAALAQARPLWLRFDAGVAQPVGRLDDFFDPGPSFGASVVRPLGERLAVVLKTDIDMLNNHDLWPVPDARLWRYELGVEADVLGLFGVALERYGLRLYGGIGGMTLESDPFLTEFAEPVYPYPWEELFKTYPSGSGALSFGFGLTEVVSGWLTGQIHWSPVDEGEMEILSEATSFTQSPLGSALAASIRLGFSYRLGG